jgi:hypothetical protein
LGSHPAKDLVVAVKFPAVQFPLEEDLKIIQKALFLSVLTFAALGWCQSIAAPSVVTTIEGQDTATDKGTKPDPMIAVGPSQVVQWADNSIDSWQKSGLTVTTGYPKAFASLFNGTTQPQCAASVGSGNGYIVYDKLADGEGARFVAHRRVKSGSGLTASYYSCIAVSSSNNLSTATWKTYQFQLTSSTLGAGTGGYNLNFPDFPQLAAWGDAYYVTYDLLDPGNSFQIVGVAVCAFDRHNMFNGGTMRTPQCKKYLPNEANFYLGHTLIPAAPDSTSIASAGEHMLFVSSQLSDGTGSFALGILSGINKWKFHVDWTTPANSWFGTNSTTTGPTKLALPVAMQGNYFQGCFSAANGLERTVCVPQPGVSQQLDSLGDRLGSHASYRNWTGTGAHEAIWVTMPLQLSVGGAASFPLGLGVFEVLDPDGVATVNQGMFWSPDSILDRFLGSAAVNKSETVAWINATSDEDAGKFPSIEVGNCHAYSGGSPACSAANAASVQAKAGAGTTTAGSDYGGYSGVVVDPSDDCTFWGTAQYLKQNVTTGSVWYTRIIEFKQNGGATCP